MICGIKFVDNSTKQCQTVNIMCFRLTILCVYTKYNNDQNLHKCVTKNKEQERLMNLIIAF